MILCEPNSLQYAIHMPTLLEVSYTSRSKAEFHNYHCKWIWLNFTSLLYNVLLERFYYIILKIFNGHSASPTDQVKLYVDS